MTKPVNSFYIDIIEAPTKALFFKAVSRLITRRLYKVRLPQEVREEFCNDIFELHFERFGSSISPNFANLMSTYFMQDDTRGGLSGANKTAKCSSFEHSFFSDRTEKRIRGEDYFKEASWDKVSDWAFYTDGGIRDVEGVLDILEDIRKADLSSEELEMLRLNVIEGYTLRELAEIKGNVSKSKLGGILKSAKNKIK